MANLLHLTCNAMIDRSAFD